MTIQPLNEMVLIQPEMEPDVTESGIMLPQGVRKSYQKGLVLASDWDAAQPLQNVLYTPHGAIEVLHNGTKSQLVPKSQILAVVNA